MFCHLLYFTQVKYMIQIAFTTRLSNFTVTLKKIKQDKLFHFLFILDSLYISIIKKRNKKNSNSQHSANHDHVITLDDIKKYIF